MKRSDPDRQRQQPGFFTAQRVCCFRQYRDEGNLDSGQRRNVGRAGTWALAGGPPQRLLSGLASSVMDQRYCKVRSQVQKPMVSTGMASLSCNKKASVKSHLGTTHKSSVQVRQTAIGHEPTNQEHERHPKDSLSPKFRASNRCGSLAKTVVERGQRRTTNC